MDLTLFNTLSRRREVFQPLKSKRACVYTCGPTVYQYAHLGNLRAYVFTDVLRRTLELNGYRVRQVINITDVGHLASDQDIGEDKIEAAAKKEGRSVGATAKRYTAAFLADLRQLNVKTVGTVFPRASDHIPEQIALIKRLWNRGFAYRINDGVYFDVAKYPDYEKLGRLTLAQLKVGARVVLNPEKRQPWDFALWKFSQPEDKRQQEWDSPWGRGWPGWHIECSAMSIKYLGETFDIHTGGIDHIMVHHTNERAQSEGATGRPFVHYWLHNEFVVFGQGKMAKSAGNVVLLRDLKEKGIDPLAYRYWLLGVHYRKPVRFSWRAIVAADSALRRLRQYCRRAPTRADQGSVNGKFSNRFLAALNNDLNTSAALAVVWEVAVSKLRPADKRATLLRFGRALGLRLGTSPPSPRGRVKIPAAVKQLVKEREKARKGADWPLADRIRRQISRKGFIVEDTVGRPNIYPRRSERVVC